MKVDLRVSLAAALLLAAIVSLGSAQTEKCGIIETARELGNVNSHSDTGVIADALRVSGNNPRIQITDFQVTCSVVDTEADTYQYLSVVILFSCQDEPTLRCNRTVLGGNGPFVAQFELRCTNDGNWVLGDDMSTVLEDTFTNSADGSLATRRHGQCGACYSTKRASDVLQSSIPYDSDSHCASCRSGCLSEGSGYCTDLGARSCCPFYHDSGNGFRCIDVCPRGFSPNTNSSVCIHECPNLAVPVDGSIQYNPVSPPRLKGTVATYNCSTNFTLTGNNNQTTRRCTNGAWSGSDPSCQINCGVLTIGNGKVSYNQTVAGRSDTELGAVATYSCNALYSLNGNANRVCGANSTWSGTEPTCVPPPSPVPRPSPVPPPSPDQSSGFPAWTIALIVVAIMLVVIVLMVTIICIILCILLWRYRHDRGSDIILQGRRNEDEVKTRENVSYSPIAAESLKQQEPIYDEPQ